MTGRGVRRITPATARRLAVARQRLCGPRPRADAAGVMEVLRDLGCAQLDPISVVAPSHRLVLWSRVGAYDPALWDELRWRDQLLFEYWAHAASIVLTENYPIHAVAMRRYRAGTMASPHTRAWLKTNGSLRRYVLGELRRRGPIRSADLEDRSETEWRSSGWTAGRNVDRMLTVLWFRGEVMVAGRASGHKLWDLRERVLPDELLGERLTTREAVRRAAQQSLRALGAATPMHITRHFTRWEYPELTSVLVQLERARLIESIEVADAGTRWPGRWYVHVDSLPTLEAIERGDFEPRTTLLSPFDNLICDRARTKLLFGFDYRLEIYVPPAKRRYGYYVLSLLQGDRLIGRIDAAFDRAQSRLRIHAVHAETGWTRRQVASVAEEPLEELTGFLDSGLTGRRSRALPSAGRTSESSRSRSSAARRRS